MLLVTSVFMLVADNLASLNSQKEVERPRVLLPRLFTVAHSPPLDHPTSQQGDRGRGLTVSSRDRSKADRLPFKRALD